MESIIVVTNCEKSSPLVKEHFENLHEKSKKYDFSPTLLLENDPETNNHHKEYVFASKTVDQQQELSSSFYLHYKDMSDNFLKFQLYRDHRKSVHDDNFIENVYFAQEFCRRLIRVVLSRISTTSKLMLGDLGRHAPVNTKNITNLTAYQNISNEYKKLQQLPQQTICKNNMTQGIIEQHFHGFKHTYLKGNRYVRLDQLVETIHKEVLTTQQLFADYVLHKGYAKSRNKFEQPAQRKKKNSDSCVEV